MAAYDGAGAPTRASRSSRSAASDAASCRRTPTSTWCWSTTSDVELGDLAEKVWYPLWDAGVRLDHSVRVLSRDGDDGASEDLRVALGPARRPAPRRRPQPHAAAAHHDARRVAARRPERLPALRELVRSRHERVGELAHLSVPDLKEAEGGLRDATVLKALVATWLVDVPHVDLERSRQALLDVRDVLHEASGRPTDRVAPESWDDLAGPLGLADAAAVQTHVRELGPPDHPPLPADLASRGRLLARPAVAARRRGPGSRRSRRGVALASGEVVLDRGRPTRPGPPAPAARRGRGGRARRGAGPGDRRPAGAGGRAAARSRGRPRPVSCSCGCWRPGRGLLPVWETLEETGALGLVLPEWERIRLLPHASPIHRFTVDRHVVETCVEASALIRPVRPPDVLMVAALLHDIGKGGLTEHSVAGEPIARADRDADGVRRRGGRAHRAARPLAPAARRDRDHARPGRSRHPRCASPRGSARPRRSRCCVALTEADARATAPQAWSRWRAGLVLQVGRAALATLAPGAAPATPLRRSPRRSR